MATFNFYINNDPKSKSAEKIIFAYIREKGKTLVLHTGERINPKHWNSNNQSVKKSYTGHPELNSFLAAYKKQINDIKNKIRTENPESSFEEVKQVLIKRFKDKQDNNFFEVYDLFLKARSTELTKGSLQKYYAIKQHLTDFQNTEKFNLSFSSINLEFYDKFTYFLINTKKHSNNTISKLTELLKVFLNWSFKRKFNQYLEYKEFKTKKTAVDIIYLTENELMTLFNFDLTKQPALEKVRDVFCFACFTGQRFSDVHSIKRDDINKKFWNLRTTKTKDILKIPLNNFASEILNKYAANENPLPVVSNPKTNKHLKELCQLVGINDTVKISHYRGAERNETTYKKYELVTTHTARRTFVTLSLEKGMRPETVMEITGHKDYKTFKKYIKLTSKVKEIEMNQIWNTEPNLKLVSKLG